MSGVVLLAAFIAVCTVLMIGGMVSDAVSERFERRHK